MRYDFPVFMPASVELPNVVLLDPAGYIPRPNPVTLVAEAGLRRHIPNSPPHGWAVHAQDEESQGDKQQAYQPTEGRVRARTAVLDSDLRDGAPCWTTDYAGLWDPAAADPASITPGSCMETYGS